MVTSPEHRGTSGERTADIYDPDDRIEGFRSLPMTWLAPARHLCPLGKPRRHRLQWQRDDLAYAVSTTESVRRRCDE